MAKKKEQKIEWSEGGGESRVQNLSKAFSKLINISWGVPKPQLEKWREYILEFFSKVMSALVKGF